MMSDEAACFLAYMSSFENKDDDFSELIDDLLAAPHVSEAYIIDRCNAHGFFYRKDFSNDQWRELQRICGGLGHPLA